MKPEQLSALWHALGMTRSNYRRSLTWWFEDGNHRNNFAVEPQSNDHVTALSLADLGLMVRAYTYPGGLEKFEVTAKGMKVARDSFTRPIPVSKEVSGG
jgi:hypothetical protein